MVKFSVGSISRLREVFNVSFESSAEAHEEWLYEQLREFIMKRFLKIVVSCALLFLGSKMAVAGSPFDPSIPKHEQYQQGVVVSQLAPDETGRLESEHSGFRQEDVRAMGSGKWTRSAGKKLKDGYQTVSKKSHKKKNAHKRHHKKKRHKKSHGLRGR